MIRPVEPPSSVGRRTRSMSQQSKKRIDVSSTRSFTFLLFQFRGQSEAATKTLSDWAIPSSKEGDLVWFKVFSLPSDEFQVISDSGFHFKNRRFFLFSVGKLTKGSFSAVDKWSQLAHVTFSPFSSKQDHYPSSQFESS